MGGSRASRYSANRNTRSFIYQRSSWGYLQISAEMFQKLVAAHTVTSAILDAVHSFGAKVTGEDDPLFNICHYSPFIRDPEDQVVHGGRFSGELISQFAMTIAQHKSRVLLYHTVFRKAWQNGAQTSMVTKTNILISQVRSGHSEIGLDSTSTHAKV